MDYKKLILRGQRDIQEIDFILRDFELDFDDILRLKKIVVLVGPRRVGKTFLFYQIIENLFQKEGFKLENIVYVNFANILLKKFDIEKLLEDYFTLFPDLKPVFFFDEIQELEDFEKVLLYLQSNGYQIFVTGSNSKLLSKEISTNLRGKYLEKFVYPLIFKEFLRFKNFERKRYILEQDIGKLKNLFLEFLMWGNFPEVVLAQNRLTKRDLINTYFKDLIYIDLIERYKIENEKVLVQLIEQILKNVGKEFSIQKFFNTLKSLGFKVSKPTIYNYLQYLQNIFFVNLIKNYFKSTNQKMYLFNIGFENILIDVENLGQRFENIVFLELIRKGYNIYYKFSKQEVDFYIPSQNLNIQVVFKLTKDNLQREIAPLLKQDGEKMIVFFENDMDCNFEEIRCVSFVDYFL